LEAEIVQLRQELSVSNTEDLSNLA
jgi:hypothetical protein